VDLETGQRRGLRSALNEAKVVLKEKAKHEKEVLREAKQALQDKARQEQATLRRKAMRERALRRIRRNR
jgi:hypothetical protein